MLEELSFIIFRGLGAGGLTAMIALSFNIVHTSSRVLNFATGNLLIAAAFVSALLYVPADGFVMWLLLAVATTIGLGLFVVVQGYITLLPLKYTEENSWLVTTMAASVIIGAVLLLTQGPFVRNAADPFPPISLFGMRTPASYGLCIALAFAWFIALHLFLTRSWTGLAISALSQDYDAARTAGIPVRRLQLVAFFVSGVILGSAGFIAAPIMSISPDAGFRYVINGFIGAIIGGLDNNLGGLVGGFTVGVLSVLSIYTVGGEFESAITLALMVTVLMIRPQGLFGRTQARRV